MRPDSSRLADLQDDPGYDEAIAHLSVVLAHRLRGLVAGIEGFTDLLNHTLGEVNQRELAMKILEGTARIESVLSDLQLYGASLDPVMLPVRVEELLRDLLVPLDETARARVEVDVEATVLDRMMLADPFLLRRLVLALVQNALEAHRGSATVRLRVHGHGRSVHFEVWNSGTIDLEAGPEAVFAPFFTTKAHNLGVGLSIARRIARLHDADVELMENDSRRGTCFAFTLDEPEEDERW